MQVSSKPDGHLEACIAGNHQLRHDVRSASPVGRFTNGSPADGRPAASSSCNARKTIEFKAY